MTRTPIAVALLVVAALPACGGGTAPSLGTGSGYSRSAYATPPTYLGRPSAIDRFWHAVEQGKSERQFDKLRQDVQDTNALLAQQNRLLRKKKR